MPFSPQFMEPLLILINTMRSIILLQQIIEPRSSHITNNFQYIFITFNILICLKLSPQCLQGTGVKDINNTCIHYLMKDEAIMSAVMEYFQYFWVTKYVTKNFFTQLECLYIAVLQYLLDVNQECIDACIYLYHFDVSVPSETSL